MSSPKKNMSINVYYIVSTIYILTNLYIYICLLVKDVDQYDGNRRKLEGDE